MTEPIPEIIDLSPRPVNPNHWTRKIPDLYQRSPEEQAAWEAWLARVRIGL